MKKLMIVAAMLAMLPMAAQAKPLLPQEMLGHWCRSKEPKDFTGKPQSYKRTTAPKDMDLDYNCMLIRADNWVFWGETGCKIIMTIPVARNNYVVKCEEGGGNEQYELKGNRLIVSTFGEKDTGEAKDIVGEATAGAGVTIQHVKATMPRLPQAMLGDWCPDNIDNHKAPAIFHKKTKLQPMDEDCFTLRTNELVRFEESCDHPSIQVKGQAYTVKWKCGGYDQRWRETTKYMLAGNSLMVWGISDTYPE